MSTFLKLVFGTKHLPFAKYHFGVVKVELHQNATCPFSIEMLLQTPSWAIVIAHIFHILH